MQDKIVDEYEEKLYQQSQKSAEELREVTKTLTDQMKDMEDTFTDERTRMRQQLHDVTSNEINLLNRIKSLESEQGKSCESQ